MEFKQRLKLYGDTINNALEKYVPELDTPERTIYRAMRYSLMAGGKRLRPALVLATGEILQGEADEVLLAFGCAIEMIHTYSLIHDDLPAMDNDDYRRGRLTSHKVFGEGAAVLAGDALLNRAFEIMIDTTVGKEKNYINYLKAMNCIASASGCRGMIGGQMIDLESEGKRIDISTLEYMHRCKTGALIKAPVQAAGYICAANREQMKALEDFADYLGLAFQIKDDILDLEGDSVKLGKNAGSDVQNNKSTYVSINGLDKSKEFLKEATYNSISSLDIFGEKAWFLVELARYLVEREN